MMAISRACNRFVNKRLRAVECFAYGLRQGIRDTCWHCLCNEMNRGRRRQAGPPRKRNDKRRNAKNLEEKRRLNQYGPEHPRNGQKARGPPGKVEPFGGSQSLILGGREARTTRESRSFTNNPDSAPSVLRLRCKNTGKALSGRMKTR